MNNTIEKINGSGWADWSFSKLEIDYDKVEVSVLSDSENRVKICCRNYIGFSFMGHWDESIIGDIRVETYGNVIDESLQVVKKLYGESPLLGGGVKRIDDVWYQVNIKLIDGNTVKIACRNIEVV
jgi:hypothetical protein